MQLEIKVTSSYGALSRGRHSARKGTGSDVQWADKDARGAMIINSPGIWKLHCSDGFKRTATATLQVDDEGAWEMTGDVKRFDVLE